MTSFNLLSTLCLVKKTRGQLVLSVFQTVYDGCKFVLSPCVGGLGVMVECNFDEFVKFPGISSLIKPSLLSSSSSLSSISHSSSASACLHWRYCDILCSNHSQSCYYFHHQIQCRLNFHLVRNSSLSLGHMPFLPYLNFVRMPHSLDEAAPWAYLCEDQLSCSVSISGTLCVVNKTWYPC